MARLQLALHARKSCDDLEKDDATDHQFGKRRLPVIVREVDASTDKRRNQQVTALDHALDGKLAHDQGAAHAFQQQHPCRPPFSGSVTWI